MKKSEWDFFVYKFRETFLLYGQFDLSLQKQTVNQPINQTLFVALFIQ